MNATIINWKDLSSTLTTDTQTTLYLNQAAQTVDTLIFAQA